MAMHDHERRTALKAFSALALTGAASPIMGATSATHLPPPPLSFAFRLHVLIGAPQEIGMVNGARKRVIPITGGTVEGPRLSGRVLPGGADWQTIGPDGTADILARYTLEAADGSLISVTNPGFRRGPAAVLAQIAAGQDVDPALYYFRTTPRFEVAASSAHGWLGNTVFLCTAARHRDHVSLDIFEVG
jgi:hypothetical protein